MLHLPANLTGVQYHQLVQGQLAVFVERANGSLTYATGVQDAGALDDLYAYTGQLGVVVQRRDRDDDSPHLRRGNMDEDRESGDVKVRVWAPTAQAMRLELFTHGEDTAPAKTVAMVERAGVWTATLDASSIGQYYLLDERVYAPGVRAVVEDLVTDPYSIDLALNGAKSRVIDIDAEVNKPEGWDEHRSPDLERVNDLTLY